MRLFIACCALAGLAGVAQAEPHALPGFRLLVLEDQLARWEKGSSLTYAFVTQPMAFPRARNCGGMIPATSMLECSRLTFDRFQSEVAAAFRMWESVANVTFRETGDPDRADILIGAQAEPRGRAFTNVELDARAAPGKKAIARSLICLNPVLPWKIGFDGNLSVYDLRYTVAHEIGHAIGLDHPSPSGQLMSYRYDERYDSLQRGDAAGVTRLYGPRQVAAPGRPGEQAAVGSESGGPEPGAPALGLGEPSPSPR